MRRKSLKSAPPLPEVSLVLEFNRLRSLNFRLGQIVCNLRSTSISWSNTFFERILPNVIIAPRYLWVLLFGGVFACSLVAIFYKPGIKLPDQEDFQLFTQDHLFEKYVPLVNCQQRLLYRRASFTGTSRSSRAFSASRRRRRGT